MKNKKGFTLVELLGVIIILSIILLIAIPRIASVTENSKKTQYLNDAKKMVTLVATDIKKGAINKPSSEETVKISLKDLKTNEVEKDKDGLIYDIENSYVYITRKEGNLEYYVQLVAQRKDGKYRGILLINSKELDKDTQYEKYYEIIDELIYIDPDDVDSGVFNVGITGSNVTLSESNIKIGFNKSKSIIVTPLDGYYLSSVKCINGYTTNAMTGKEMANRQIVTISNNKVRGESKCTFVASKIEYNVTLNLTHITSSEDAPMVRYLDSKRIDIEPEEGYYLDNVSCSDGYSIEAITGIEGVVKQTAVIINNGTKQGGTCSFEGRRSYPKVTGGSDAWATGTRTFTITEPTKTDLINSYEYYVSNNNETPSKDVVATGSFTGNSINIGENGKYVYFRIIYANGVVSNWTSAKDLYIDNTALGVPTVIGGDTLLTLSKTYILSGPETTSGISKYEYYISDSNIKPSGNVEVTGSFMTSNITINKDGKYIYFRAVNNIGQTGGWTDAVNLYVDTNTYSITYNLNGGNLQKDEITSYNVETEIANLPLPQKTGNGFVGWYGNSSFTGEKVESIPLGSAGNKVYYAKWVAKAYTITLSAVGATTQGTEKVTVQYDNNMITITPPTKTGYTFGGYYIEPDGNGTQYYKPNGTSDKKWDNQYGATLYAKWTANKYTVTYDANGGSVSTTTKQVTYDSTYGQLPTPNAPGSSDWSLSGTVCYSTTYTFLGWYTTKTGGSVINAPTKVTTAGNHTIYAHWNSVTNTKSASLTCPYTSSHGHYYLDTIDDTEHSRDCNYPIGEYMCKCSWYNCNNSCGHLPVQYGC